jgi:hypothetical protein
LKTIKTQKIDDYDIVIGICDAESFIDQEATKIKVNKIIKDEKIYKDIEKFKDQLSTYIYQSNKALVNAKKAKDKSERDKFTNEYQSRQKDIKDIQNDLKPMAVEFEKKYRELILSNAEYFGLQEHEIYIEDSEAAKFETLMIDATQNGDLVDKDKNIIQDNRGKIYWLKSGDTWNKAEILNLGDIPAVGAKEFNDLSIEEKQEIIDQVETDRIAALSSTQKAEEKALKLSDLITQAAQMKSELEVQGESNALQISQDWLAAESDKLDLIYA